MLLWKCQIRLTPDTAMKRWNQADTVNDGPVNLGDRLSRYASPRSLTTWQVVSKSDSPRVLQCIVRVLEGASKGICWNRSWSSGGLDCTLDLQWQRECFPRCNQLQVMSKAPYTFDMCPPKYAINFNMRLPETGARRASGRNHITNHIYGQPASHFIMACWYLTSKIVVPVSKFTHTDAVSISYSVRTSFLPQNFTKAYGTRLPPRKVSRDAADIKRIVCFIMLCRVCV